MPKNESKQAADFPPRGPSMNTLPEEPQSFTKKQEYAYRVAAVAAALFLLLTWLTA
jgi:hypothetical protein